MTAAPPSRPPGRRAVLRLAGLGALGAAGVPLAGCTGPGEPDRGEAAEEVTGSFSWRKAEGARIRFLQVPHPYQASLQPLLADFTALTGIEVVPELVAEEDYFAFLNTELAGGTGRFDVFMASPYSVWQFAPPGWMEQLGPWLDNPGATDPAYEFEDVFEGLRAATRWDLRPGSRVGRGAQWAIPWGFETTALTYDRETFDARGIRPPETLDELVQLASDLTDRSAGRYGLAVRGARSSTTVHSAYMTQFARAGAVDFVADDDGRLRAAMDSPEGVALTDAWVRAARDGGPPEWTRYTWRECASDLGRGTALMCYDADAVTYPLQRPRGSARAGALGWHPGPPGPDGSYATNLWTWALAIDASSSRKLAAWLFVQWATGAEAMTRAVREGAFANPARESVFRSAFTPTLADFPGYLDSFERVVDSTAVRFTPHASSVEVTRDWSVALQNVYAGADAGEEMERLARASEDLLDGP